MPRYIAFLRAINVGGHTVKMDRLRQIFESLDFCERPRPSSPRRECRLRDNGGGHDRVRGQDTAELQAALGYRSSHIYPDRRGTHPQHGL